MAKSEFDFPSLEGLREGQDYRVLEWSEAKEFFSDFANECADGEKMIFGACRKVGGTEKNEKDFDSSKKTKQEEDIETEAKKQKSDVKSNKPFTINGKRYGWAIKNGKPVVVEWGSVSGEKKVGPKKDTKKKGNTKKDKGKDNNDTLDAQIRGKRKALEKQESEAGRNAILKQIEELEAQR